MGTLLVQTKLVRQWSITIRVPETYSRKGCLNVVIETPKFSNFKYDYDPKRKIFKVKKSLPQGMHFPFNFGFIPGTLGEDGDPLDILVLSENALGIGVVGLVALTGVMEAEQIEKGETKPIRNDRFLGCLVDEDDDAESMFSSVAELPPMLKSHIEAFFVNFDLLSGKTFKPIAWHGPNHAKTLLEIGIEKGATGK